MAVRSMTMLPSEALSAMSVYLVNANLYPAGAVTASRIMPVCGWQFTYSYV